MQLSERIKATASEVIRFARQLLSPFDMDDFARQILVKDVSLLRQRFRGQLPKSLTATDVAAHLELHDASMRLVSEHCVTEGFHILKGAEFYQVVKTEHGRRQNLAVVKHIHAALIIYCEHLLADLRRSQPRLGVAAQSRLTLKTERDGAANVSIKAQLVTIEGGSQSTQPQGAQRNGRSNSSAPARRHLHLVH
jgi:hypothetical protein